MLKARFILLLCGLGLVSLASAALWSQSVATHPAAVNQPIAQEPRLNESAPMSLEQAVAMVQVRYGARAVRSNTVQEEGRVVHYIRLVSADRSRVWTVRVDAATGQEF